MVTYHLQTVAERPGRVDEHDVGAGQSGEALVEAVSVQEADLVNAPVDAEREDKHHEPGQQKDEIGRHHSQPRVVEQDGVRQLEPVERRPNEHCGQDHAPDGRGHVKLPRAGHVYVKDVADDDLCRLEKLVRVDVPRLGEENEGDPDKGKDPVEVPDLEVDVLGDVGGLDGGVGDKEADEGLDVARLVQFPDAFGRLPPPEI
jgi:hypothetical protein